MRFSFHVNKQRRDSTNKRSSDYRISDFTRSLLMKEPRKSILKQQSQAQSHQQQYEEDSVDIASLSLTLNNNDQQQQQQQQQQQHTAKKRVHFPSASSSTSSLPLSSMIGIAANRKLSAVCWWDMQELQAIQQGAQQQAQKLATSKQEADVSYRKVLKKFYKSCQEQQTTQTPLPEPSNNSYFISTVSSLDDAFAFDLRRRFHNSQSRSGLEYQVMECMGISLAQHRQAVLQHVLQWQQEYSSTSTPTNNNLQNRMLQQHMAQNLRQSVEPWTIASKVRAREMGLVQRPFPENDEGA